MMATGFLRVDSVEEACVRPFEEPQEIIYRPKGV